jgi:hypothetical protein
LCKKKEKKVRAARRKPPEVIVLYGKQNKTDHVFCITQIRGKGTAFLAYMQEFAQKIALEERFF